MAFLDSTATIGQLKDKIDDTSSYDLGGGVEMCKEHIDTCRKLISRTADETRQGSAALREAYQRYQYLLEKAERWLAANDATYAGNVGGGSVRVVTTSGLRDL